MGIAQKRKYTNKHFKDNFVDLASNQVKTGHLTNEAKKDGKDETIEGTLKHILKDRIDSNGWIVEVGTGKQKTQYKCTNPQWTLSMPDSTETETMYVPKTKTRVEFTRNKKTKINTITRVIGGKSPFSNYQGTLKISIDENDKTNQNVNASITVTADEIELGAKSVVLSANGQKTDLVKTQETQANQIKILINENTILKEKINSIEQKLNGAS